MDRIANGWVGWRSITLSVRDQEPFGYPVVSGDLDYFRPILASVLSGGRYMRFGRMFGGVEEGRVVDEGREVDEGSEVDLGGEVEVMNEGREVEVLREENMQVSFCFLIYLIIFFKNIVVVIYNAVVVSGRRGVIFSIASES